MIINIGNNKVSSNYKFSPKLTSLHNTLIMSIVDTPENDAFNYEKFHNN